ncbi:MAG: hypothetical protein A2487_04295 [Candidatus Raymondbacteria bacterium RifOxyC12_full_50_8]|nr:MAG: hypothetical protein A2248_00235 [Candidatus Raymondbacteria bacterium RIFOXYA2_FULL_49_16]OGJ96172.1 MAG: hypothetical protein A2453_05585 [Candidatus Raymondbacteria bacterium RIFOXYC2_FULL_50_21]OGK07577.1 MAG: hypothetical protein A2487_04295 [Candidatus Raymondbacteria bacterium RifOxyC12_full_50_8]OGP41275.1 MAG: hypothetical protein A2324_16775 [Candidatus Raymondbacteria bacterium RIFOXYB2_FULL_49_35]
MRCICFFIVIVTTIVLGELFQPEDLVYKGAFKVPLLSYGGWPLAYSPDGDPAGPNDGYPGSLYGMGHIYDLYVAEFSIPAPVISTNKNSNDLPSPVTLQQLTDICPVPGPYVPNEDHFSIKGMLYLPQQGAQASDKLYVNWGYNWGEPPYNISVPSQGWCNPNLADAQPTDMWSIGGLFQMLTTGYLVEIPKEWADSHVGGKYLGTGVYRWNSGRDQGGSHGPTIYAVAPWQDGNPPDSGSAVSYVELLRYSAAHPFDDSFWTVCNSTLACYKCDEWDGAVWLTSGNKSSLVFIGTKALGGCSSAGATTHKHALMFYDPADLAAVAGGTMESWEPQPYAYMDLDPYMWEQMSIAYSHRRLTQGAYDREHGLLYIMENYTLSGGVPIIHVFQHEAAASVAGNGRASSATMELTIAPSPFNATAMIRACHAGILPLASATVFIYDQRGGLADRITTTAAVLGAGLQWNPGILASGIYYIKVHMQGHTLVANAALVR